MPRSPRRAPTLGFGQFFGTPEVRHELSGFSLARIEATMPPIEVPEHTHDTAHLVLVIEGGYMTSASRLEPGRPPALVYNPPGTSHADRFRENRGIFFALSVADRHLESLRPAALPILPLSLSSGPAVRIARRLARACESWPPRSRPRPAMLCFDLLLGLQNDAERSRPRPPGWLVAARRTLESCCDDAPDLRDLAAEAEVHPVHLIRSFRRFFGVTPGKFVRERRLAAAAEMLSATDLEIV